MRGDEGLGKGCKWRVIFFRNPAGAWDLDGGDLGLPHAVTLSANGQIAVLFVYSKLEEDGFFSWIDAEYQCLSQLAGPEDTLRRAVGERKPICGSHPALGLD